jgi:hypothetical protein
MRLLLEVLGCSLETAKFPNRRSGQVEEVPFLQISGVDGDYFDSLLKVKVFRPKDLNRTFKKGEMISVKFRQAKYSDFEKSTVINANEDDVQLYKGEVKPEPIAEAA